GWRDDHPRYATAGGDASAQRRRLLPQQVTFFRHQDRRGPALSRGAKRDVSLLPEARNDHSIELPEVLAQPATQRIHPAERTPSAASRTAQANERQRTNHHPLG